MGRVSLVLQSFLMLFLPILGFIIFSFLYYPLAPHCALGEGVYGCTPVCTQGITPCFHEGPIGIQLFIYRNSIPIYFLVLAFISAFVWKVGFQKAKSLAVKVLFYPLFLYRLNLKNKNIASRITVAILNFFLASEWIIGYIIFISTLLGLENIFR